MFAQEAIIFLEYWLGITNYSLKNRENSKIRYEGVFPKEIIEKYTLIVMLK